MAHDVIERHPQWQALQEERQRLRDAELAHRQRVAEVMEPWREQMAVWEGKRNIALKTGKAPPPAPPQPDLGADEGAEHVFAREHERLREQQKQVLAAIREDVERDAADAQAEATDSARPHVEALRSIAAEVRALVQAVREVRSAVDRSNPSRRPVGRTGLAARTRSTVEVDDLLAAVDGADLLAVAPLPASNGPQVEPSEVRVGDDGVVQVTDQLRTNIGRPPRMEPPQPAKRRGEI